MEEAAKRYGGSDGTFNLCNFSEALTAQYGGKDPVDGHLCRVILADRDDVEMCSQGNSHFRIKKPSVDRVTTENFDSVDPDGRGWVPQSTAREFLKRDIRANVDLATRELREDLTKAQGESEGWRKEAMRYQGESEKMREENARIKAEVERLTKELDYLRGQSEMERTARGKWVTWQREMMGVVTSGPTAEEEGRAKIAGMMVSAKDEAGRFRAANREQRRAGAEDAVKWLGSKFWRNASEALRSAIDHGDVLRDGEKTNCEHIQRAMDGKCMSCGREQERAPEKTGRLPNSCQMVFARGSEEHPWMLIRPWCSSLEPGGKETATVDLPGFGNVKLTKENEGVLWCWPTPGMV